MLYNLSYVLIPFLGAGIHQEGPKGEEGRCDHRHQCQRRQARQGRITYMLNCWLETY